MSDAHMLLSRCFAAYLYSETQAQHSGSQTFFWHASLQKFKITLK